MRYIGSKILLLKWIQKIIAENIKISSGDIFCDIFSGTASVAGFFKNDFKIISNDLLYFSYVIQRATIKNNKVPQFKNLEKALGINPLIYFKHIDDEKIRDKKGFIYDNYSPNSKSDRQYFRNHNALKIDYIRSFLEDWREKGLIDDDEYFYLLAGLIKEIPSVSNIAGTYGAYLKSWDRRVFKEVNIAPLDIVDNGYDNECYNEDANELIKKISGTVLYMDPPYNTRQYLGNYHILETVAKYDNPEIRGKTGIRIDENKKSKYCSKLSVLKSFEELVKNAKFKHLILSYSTEGLMKQTDIEGIMKQYGIPETFKVYRKPYRRYKRVSGDINIQLEELLFYIRKDI